MLGWVAERTVLFVSLAAFFGCLSLVCGLFAGVGGHIEAAIANQKAAEAQARTAEAQVKVETLRRRLDKRIPDKQAMVPILREAPASVEIAYSKEDMDSIIVATVIERALIEAGWTVTAKLPVPAEELARKVPSTAWWYIEEFNS